MGQIPWDEDITIQVSGGSGNETTYMSYSSRSPFNEYAFGYLSTSQENVWFYAVGDPISSDGVSSGDKVYIGSYAGIAMKHWLGDKDSKLGNLLPWQKWGDYNDGFYWIITSTDGSSSINDGTTFTLQASDGSGYLIISPSDQDFLNIGDQADALVFKASTT